MPTIILSIEKTITKETELTIDSLDELQEILDEIMYGDRIDDDLVESYLQDFLCDDSESDDASASFTFLYKDGTQLKHLNNPKDALAYMKRQEYLKTQDQETLRMFDEEKI